MGIKATSVVLIYIGMLIFDTAILGGAVYLIGWCGWSPWWMVFAVVMASGSNPKNVIKAMYCKPSCNCARGDEE